MGADVVIITNKTMRQDRTLGVMLREPKFSHLRLFHDGKPPEAASEKQYGNEKRSLGFISGMEFGK
jgi:hypothetical protein